MSINCKNLHWDPKYRYWMIHEILTKINDTKFRESKQKRTNSNEFKKIPVFYNENKKKS